MAGLVGSRRFVGSRASVCGRTSGRTVVGPVQSQYQKQNQSPYKTWYHRSPIPRLVTLAPPSSYEKKKETKKSKAVHFLLSLILSPLVLWIHSRLSAVGCRTGPIPRQTHSITNCPSYTSTAPPLLRQETVLSPLTEKRRTEHRFPVCPSAGMGRCTRSHGQDDVNPSSPSRPSIRSGQSKG